MWIKDPKNDKPSVSLTILALSIVILLVSGVLEMMGKIQSTSIAAEFFYGACATYFGRRVKFGDKEFGQNADIPDNTNTTTKYGDRNAN